MKSTQVKSKNPLTLYESMGLLTPGLRSEQILFIMQKTPDEHIYQRPARGGGQWDYVTGAYVKKVLNYTFGWNWDFTIKDRIIEYGQIAILGQLKVITLDGNEIIKEQWGRAEVKYKKNTKEPLDFGNDLKAASTDCLKKCASEFGIASDVYAKNEFKEIKMEKVEVPEETLIVNGEEPANEEQLETLKHFGYEVTNANLTKQEAADKIAELLEAKK